MGTTTITVQIVSLVIGVFLPLVVAFVTKMTTHPSVKAILLLFFSALSSFFTEMANSWPHFDVKTALVTWGGTFIVGVGLHFGLWKPTSASAAFQKVGVK